MSPPPQAEQRNLLLRRMPPADYDLLAPHLHRVEMPRGLILFRPGEAAGHAFFFTGGVGSLVAISPEGQRVEAGLFGREGFGPTAMAIGDDRPVFEGSAQLPGRGFRIAAEPLLAALDASTSLRTLLQKFAHILSVQAGFTALSNAVHPIEERLARWILMCDDRLDTGELPLTHEFMSVMLAVRRPSVTTALHVLEGNGLVRTERGIVTVRNRAALESFAGDAYGTPEREYERLLGPMRPTHGERDDLRHP